MFLSIFWVRRLTLDKQIENKLRSYKEKEAGQRKYKLGDLINSEVSENATSLFTASTYVGYRHPIFCYKIELENVSCWVTRARAADPVMQIPGSEPKLQRQQWGKCSHFPQNYLL